MLLHARIIFSLCCCALLLFFSCSEEKPKQEKTDDEKITFSSHIAPLIFKTCAPCHRPGEAGPFPLLSYADVKKNANRIRFAINTHFMPPWPADPNYTHFVGERVLSPEEKIQLLGWLQQGMPLGDSSKIPSSPDFYTGSFFGKPDLVVSMQNAVQLKSGDDHFLVIKMPFEMEHDTFVRAVEFVPDKRKLIHHVNGHTVNYDENKKTNLYEGKYVLDDMQDNFSLSFKEMGLANNDGTFPALTPNTVYYLPGFTPPQYPDDIGGYRLKKKGAFLLKNIHYGPSKENTNDSSVINVFFAPKAPLRPVKEMQMGTFGVSAIEPPLEIPANEVKTFHTQYTVPADISILSVNPHMHLLGKKFLAYALTPQNDTIKLIRIHQWDFRWQYYYTFEHMVKIPAGSTIHAYATYDNTKENLLNPFSPPQTIRERKGTESMKTTEEMFQFIFTYLPYKAGDETVSLKRN